MRLSEPNLKLNLILKALFYFLSIAFAAMATFGKPEKETNLMLWAIWCLIMVNSRRES